MSLYFVKAGIQTSIQDSGRKGFMHLGISHSGAMDKNSQQMANLLVDKPPNSAVLEITLIGPKIRFDAATTVAVCGAKFNLTLNYQPVANDETIWVGKGDVLEFKQALNGARAYLAIAGELNLKKNLKSYSTHLTAKLGGFENRQIADHDYLETKDDTLLAFKKAPKRLAFNYSGNYLLRCVAAVESELFSPQQTKQFFSQKYQVTPQLNRMGIRLGGDPLKFKNKLEIISSGLTQGSVQITPSGQPIISSVDGQTIGGYPRIANIISTDLPLLGQLKMGDQLSFTPVDQAFAESSLFEAQRLLSL